MLKRDTDLIRDILLKIDGGQKMFETICSDEAPLLGISLETPMSREEADKLRYHLDLLDRNGSIEIEARLAAGSYVIKDLTPIGHDYLDRFRDPEISQTAKSSAVAAGEEPRKDRLISDEKNPEVFTLKPTFMGMSVNLKALATSCCTADAPKMNQIVPIHADFPPSSPPPASAPPTASLNFSP